MAGRNFASRGGTRNNNNYGGGQNSFGGGNGMGAMGGGQQYGQQHWNSQPNAGFGAPQASFGGGGNFSNGRGNSGGRGNSYQGNNNNFAFGQQQQQQQQGFNNGFGGGGGGNNFNNFGGGNSSFQQGGRGGNIPRQNFGGGGGGRGFGGGGHQNNGFMEPGIDQSYQSQQRQQPSVVLFHGWEDMTVARPAGDRGMDLIMSDSCVKNYPDTCPEEVRIYSLLTKGSTRLASAPVPQQGAFGSTPPAFGGAAAKTSYQFGGAVGGFGSGGFNPQAAAKPGGFGGFQTQGFSGAATGGVPAFGQTQTGFKPLGQQPAGAAFSFNGQGAANAFLPKTSLTGGNKAAFPLTTKPLGTGTGWGAQTTNLGTGFNLTPQQQQQQQSQTNEEKSYQVRPLKERFDNFIDSSDILNDKGDSESKKESNQVSQRISGNDKARSDDDDDDDAHITTSRRASNTVGSGGRSGYSAPKKSSSGNTMIRRSKTLAGDDDDDSSSNSYANSSTSPNTKSSPGFGGGGHRVDDYLGSSPLSGGRGNQEPLITGLDSNFKYSPFSLVELKGMSDYELSNVQRFTITNPRFGSIRWIKKVNLCKLDFSGVVLIDSLSVEVKHEMCKGRKGSYDNDGDSLDSEAEITLGFDGVFSGIRKEDLIAFCQENGSKFISFEIDKDSGYDYPLLKFEVSHFSKYSFLLNFAGENDEDNDDASDENNNSSSTSSGGGFVNAMQVQGTKQSIPDHSDLKDDSIKTYLRSNANRDSSSKIIPENVLARDHNPAGCRSGWSYSGSYLNARGKCTIPFQNPYDSINSNGNGNGNDFYANLDEKELKEVLARWYMNDGKLVEINNDDPVTGFLKHMKKSTKRTENIGRFEDNIELFRSLFSNDTLYGLKGKEEKVEESSLVDEKCSLHESMRRRCFEEWLLRHLAVAPSGKNSLQDPDQVALDHLLALDFSKAADVIDPESNKDFNKSRLAMVVSQLSMAEDAKRRKLRENKSFFLFLDNKLPKCAQLLGGGKGANELLWSIDKWRKAFAGAFAFATMEDGDRSDVLTQVAKAIKILDSAPAPRHGITYEVSKKEVNYKENFKREEGIYALLSLVSKYGVKEEIHGKRGENKTQEDKEDEKKEVFSLLCKSLYPHSMSLPDLDYTGSYMTLLLIDWFIAHSSALGEVVSKTDTRWVQIVSLIKRNLISLNLSRSRLVGEVDKKLPVEVTGKTTNNEYSNNCRSSNYNNNSMAVDGEYNHWIGYVDLSQNMASIPSIPSHITYYRQPSTKPSRLPSTLLNDLDYGNSEASYINYSWNNANFKL